MNTHHVLDGVISQFADPLACLRELVQNAIDAESNRIDVWFDQRDGMYRIAVEDYGTGMTRDDIDRYLLHVFKSSKEDDLQTIGRFGIGFVSVFALQPAWVVVETSRDDEDTRLVVGADLSVRLYEGEPRVGTCVSLYLPLESEARFQSLRTDAVRFLREQCGAVTVELVAWVNDEPIDLNTPFELDLPITAALDEEGTEIRVGFGDESPHYTLMNRRLVLDRQPRALLPGVTVLASSHDIEHNLARNAVLQDEHFERFMGRLRDLVERDLLPQLIERLEQRSGGRATLIAAAALMKSPGSESRPWSRVGDLEVVDTVEKARRRTRSMSHLREAVAEGRVVIVARRDEAAEAVSEERIVAISTSEWPVRVALEAFGDGPIPSVETDWLVARPTRDRAARTLTIATMKLAQRANAPVIRLSASHISVPGAAPLLVRAPGEREAWLADDALGDAPRVALSTKHPTFRHALAQWGVDHTLAVQLLTTALVREGVFPQSVAELALTEALEEDAAHRGGARGETP